MRTTLLALAVSACGVASFAFPVSATVIYDSLSQCQYEDAWSGPTISNGGTPYWNESTWTMTPTSSGSITDITLKYTFYKTAPADDRGSAITLTQGTNTETSDTMVTGILDVGTNTTTWHFPDTFNYVSGTVITFRWHGFDNAFPFDDPGAGGAISLVPHQQHPRPSHFGLYNIWQQQDNDADFEFQNTYDVENCMKLIGTSDVATSTHDATFDAALPTVAWGFDTGINATSVTRDAMNRRLGIATSTFPMCIVYNWSLIVDNIIGPTTGSPNPQTLKLTTHTGEDQTLEIDLRNGVGTNDTSFIAFTQTIGNFFLSIMWFAFGFYILTDLLLKKKISDDDV